MNNLYKTLFLVMIIIIIDLLVPSNLKFNVFVSLIISNKIVYGIIKGSDSNEC